MANLPQLRRLMLQDFVSQKSWISPMFVIINTFMQALITALSSNLTVKDNLSGKVESVTLTALPSIRTPYQILWRMSAAPTIMLKANITSVQNTVLTEAFDFQWAYDSTNGVINIYNIIGITPTLSNSFTITFVILTG